MLANIIPEITKFFSKYDHQNPKYNLDTMSTEDTIQTEILHANPKDLAKYLETFIDKVDAETNKKLNQWISILNNC